MGGLAFLSAETVLPKMIKSLGGADWLAGLMPIMTILGFTLIPIATANYIKKLHTYKPSILFFTVGQRLVYLFTGIFLLFWGEAYPFASLIFVALTPLISGLFGGSTMAAWLGLVAKTVPDERRSSLWAWRFIMTAGIGIGAGIMVEYVLENYEGTAGYGILHFLTFAFLVLSYVFFAGIKEHCHQPEETAKRKRFRDSLREIPRLIKNDKQARYFIIARSLYFGIYLIVPLMGIYALDTLKQPESYLGNFVKYISIGAILGNLLGGFLGDKLGSKYPIILSCFLFILMAVWMPFAQIAWEFSAIFGIFGFAFFMSQVGNSTLFLSLAPRGQLTNYVCAITVAVLPFMVLFSVLGAPIKNASSFGWLSAFAVFFSILSLIFYLFVRDPRKKQNEEPF